MSHKTPPSDTSASSTTAQSRSSLLEKAQSSRAAKHNPAGWIGEQILKRRPILQTIPDIEELQKRFADSGKSQITLEMVSAEAIRQQKLLVAHQQTEYVLFLAVTKLLAGDSIYKQTAKSILSQQLHRLEPEPLPRPIAGREKEIAEIRRVFHRSERNHILISGPTGVGKTTLALALQSLIPEMKLYQLFPSSGGMYEQLVTILSSDEARKPVFFLDEIYTFPEKHIALIMENAQVIATANDNGYGKFAADLPHIIAQFAVIKLDEPTESELMQLFQDYQQMQSISEGIPFEADFTKELINLGRQYVPDPSFPAKGLILIDETVQQARQTGADEVTVAHVRTVISEKMNVPIGSLTEIDKKDLSQLPEKIRLKVKGQDEAVNTVSRTIQRSRLGFGKGNRPIGSFLFVGPSGVGKTELAKTLAEAIFGDAEAMVRIDMSEFGEAHMVQRLIGAPPGYVGYEEGGQLTNPVRKRPYTLVLLDEIEKAHPRVFDIFLQVLDDGRLTDGMGKQVDFRNTIVIATSNAGIEDLLDMIEQDTDQQTMITELKEILQDFFRIEFINRFDSIVVFNPLKPPQLVEIARLHLNLLQDQMAGQGVTLTVQDESIKQLAERSYDPRYGARGLIRLIQEQIENQLAEMILSGDLKPGARVEF
ncbi:MAG: AAA family ATPase [Patescibacteria group bacterium]